MNRDTLRDLTVFSLLLAFGVIGRSIDHAWNFTPLTAVTALGAFYFRSWLPAILLLVLQIAFSGSFTFLKANTSLIASVTLYCLLMVIVLTFGMTALSSLSRSSRFVGILFAGVLIFSDAMFNALRFSRDVGSSLSAEDLRIVVGGQAAVADTVDFSYDAGTRTGTWTVATPPAGEVRLELPGDGVVDAKGQALDGNGDGTAGGNLVIELPLPKAP